MSYQQFQLGKRSNDALRINGETVNGVTADIHITVRGSDWYWTVCAVMTVATFVFLGMSMRLPRQNRVFHYITAGITMVAAIAYFSMASNLGFVPITVEFMRKNPKVAGILREIFYVRYIDWFITTPLLLLDLLLTAGMPLPTIAFVILVDEVMIVTGLVGALVRSSYKWGYFAFGCTALFYIVYMLAFEARNNARALGDDVHRVFLSTGSLTTLLWILYPIAWGVCEGGNVISPDSEAIFYGILDLFAKPVFGAILLFGHRNIDPARLGLGGAAFAGAAAVAGGAYAEKHGRHHGHHGTAANNGVVGTGATTGATTGAATGTNGVGGIGHTNGVGHHDGLGHHNNTVGTDAGVHPTTAGTTTTV